MRVKYIAVSAAAVTLGICAFTAQANNYGDNRNWAPQGQSSNPYWQTPDWSTITAQPANRYTPPRTYNNNYNNNYRPQRPPAPTYRSPYAGNPPPANMNRPMPPASSGNVAPPPPSGPYRSAPNAVPPTGYDQGASAFNTPGYNPYRDRRRNNNKFWGRSGPSSWMNPSKGNMERGWDDMINAPSRMGEMPGGWNAPEVSMPNPIDIGDQMQDNVEDLPDQVKNMDVGN